QKKYPRHPRCPRCQACPCARGVPHDMVGIHLAARSECPSCGAKRRSDPDAASVRVAGESTARGAAEIVRSGADISVCPADKNVRPTEGNACPTEPDAPSPRSDSPRSQAPLGNARGGSSASEPTKRSFDKARSQAELGIE